MCALVEIKGEEKAYGVSNRINYHSKNRLCGRILGLGKTTRLGNRKLIETKEHCKRLELTQTCMVSFTFGS